MYSDNKSSSKNNVLLSTKTNAFMNTFIELKKLEFGVKKCNKMHIGKETLCCDDMKVHNEVGTKVDSTAGISSQKMAQTKKKNKGKV